MASQFDTSVLNAILKEVYPDGLPMDTVYKTSVLMGLLPKSAIQGFGEHHKIPVRVGNVVSSSATFATALASTTAAPVFRAFEVGLTKHYTLHGISGEAMATANGKESAFVDAVKEAVDSATYAHGRALSGMIFGSGTGEMGTVQANLSNNDTTVTIKHREARNWEVGDVFSFYDPAGVNPPTLIAAGAGNVYTVTAIDRNTDIASATPTATLTFTPAASSGSSVDAGHTLIKAGNRNAVMLGLEAWIPTNRTILGTAFNGVTRSLDGQRLAGLSADLSSMNAEEALVRGLRASADAGQTVDTAICSPAFFEEVSNRLGSKDSRERRTVKGFGTQHGYSAIRVVGGGSGEVDLIMDPDCPDNRLALLELDTWAIKHTQEGLPFMEERDGNKFLRSASSDGMDFRIISYANLICKAPGRNALFIV